MVDFDAMFATDPTLAERVLHYVGGRAPADETAEAVDVLAQAIANGFKGAGAYLAYSRALQREGQIDAARNAADQAIIAAPGNEAARNWRASLGLGRPKQSPIGSPTAVQGRQARLRRQRGTPL